MPQHRHFHIPHFHFDSSNDLRLLYIIRVLRDLANKLSFFFLTLFIFSMGFEGKLWSDSPFHPFQTGIILISAYYILHRGGVALFAIPSAKLIRPFGLRFSLLLSHLTYVGVFWLFKLSIVTPHYLFFAAILDALQVNLFWNAYHTLIGTKAKQKHLGENLGLVAFFVQLAAAISPALGGLMIVNFGYQSVFMSALVLTVIGSVFVLFLKPNKGLSNPSVNEFFNWLNTSKFKRQSLSYFGRYVNDSVLAVWPLYVFLLLGAIDKVGYLYSLSLFAAMILSFAVGFYIDHHKKTRKPFIVSGGILSLLWMIRMSVVTAWNVAVVDAFDRVVASFHWLVYDSTFIRGGKNNKTFSYFVYRETVIGISAVVFWTIFALFFMVVGQWQALFIFAAVGVLLSLLVRDNVRLRGK